MVSLLRTVGHRGSVAGARPTWLQAVIVVVGVGVDVVV